MFRSLWFLGATCKRATALRRGLEQRLRLHLETLEDRYVMSGLTLTPLMLISNPDPLASYPAGFLGSDVAVETSIAVNPTNLKNIVAEWIDHGTAGIVAGASFDGGQSWQNVAIPGITQSAGGTAVKAWDPWLSFAPNGVLYSICIGSQMKGPEQFLVNKSTDGGRTWNSPALVNATDYSGNGYGPTGDDKPSITADPTNPNFVYATWDRFNNSTPLKGNSAETMFARSTDGGQTWQPAQSIHTAPGTSFDWGNQIVVLPDGTLLDAFTEGQFNNNHQAALTLLRSTDHGQTWSAPITAFVQQPLIDPTVQPPNALVTDPDTGQAVEAHPMFVSIAMDHSSGNLYAVWIDARFSNFQHNSIALSMSTDGGFTWSNPIQVNQTPTNVPSIDQQAFNPTVAVAADGTVAVSYYDFRNNTAAPGAWTDYWLAFCHPSPTAPVTNPANWSEVRLTDSSFNLEQAPTRFNGALWLGDYEGLAAAGNAFMAAWGMPNGSSTGQESIFFRDPPPAAAASEGKSAFESRRTSASGAQDTPTVLDLANLLSQGTVLGGLAQLDPVSIASAISGPKAMASMLAETLSGALSGPQKMPPNVASMPDAGDNVSLSTLPIRPLSASAAQKGLVTDFGVDLVLDILAENMALILVR